MFDTINERWMMMMAAARAVHDRDTTIDLDRSVCQSLSRDGNRTPAPGMIREPFLKCLEIKKNGLLDNKVTHLINFSFTHFDIT
jgi:hypothetical protein